MRLIIALVLGGALALSGCDSDEGSNGSGGSGGMPGTGGTAGSSGAGGGGAGGMGGGEAPVITMVEWSTGGGCVQFTASDYTVIVTATDADSDAMDLVYAGSVSNCTGDIDQMTSVINCPNNAPYGGMVVVSDGDGNNSEPVDFQIGVCETSSVTPE